MQTHSKIATFGAGSWGTALSIALARNGHEVTLWPRSKDHAAKMELDRCNNKYLDGFDFPDNLQVNSDLQSVTQEHNIFLIAVPSHAFRGLLRRLKENGIESAANILWATKGFDSGHNEQDSSTDQVPQLLSDVVNQELGANALHAIVSGPSFSKEVAADLPTAITASGNSSDAAAFAASLFHSNTMRVYTNDDLVGVQLGGAVKNVMAIAAGISDGLGFGANSRSAIITRGLAEIARLGLSMGANRDTFLGLAGIGDLVLTCTDDQSRNRRFGLSLGRQTQLPSGSFDERVQASLKSIGQEVEGYYSTREVFKLAQHHKIEMPIIEQVYQVLFNGLAPKDAVSTLLNRELNNE